MLQKYRIVVQCILCCLSLSFGGVIAVTSAPEGAEISVNDIRTGSFTPDTVQVDTGDLYVTVLMQGSYFQSQKVHLSEGDTANLSFSQIPVFDTIIVQGREYFGILSLPEPPTDIPYLINGTMKNADTAIILPEGEYSIRWDGGIGYFPVDTTIRIYAGMKHHLDFSFEARHGRVSFFTMPENTRIYLDDTLFGVGRTIRPLKAGAYTLRFAAEGYEDYVEELVLFPGRFMEDSVHLSPAPVPDDVDMEEFCAQFEGIYPGCPQVNRWKEARNVGSFLFERFWDTPFTLELALLSFSRKRLYESDIDRFVALYNDGPPLFTNHTGVTFFPKLWVGYRGFVLSVSGGHTLQGMVYEKPYEIPFILDDSYVLAYDEFLDQSPRFLLRSFALQGGVRLTTENKNLTFSLMGGYVWESMSFTNLQRQDESDGTYTYRRSNNHGVATFRAVVHPDPRPLFPSFYGEISLTPFSVPLTGWAETSVGVILPWWRD
ncbi:PEGA domain-containing protein [Chitinivibrio alkaliphilus]|uniref:PEGA domain-containing protein n=1 Tax=Chitinivibrio alkaliphilus ACht1 TaxID=1313304 RepID=U7D793_9BACT|nr:PEGA domain-containing protein [Chitinivibrio alkaliphilus]ERP30962.1 hypothetical protein CALK_2157 [Chitinivibrio alkaliphilus ACht1]